MSDFQYWNDEHYPETDDEVELFADPMERRVVLCIHDNPDAHIVCDDVDLMEVRR